MALAMPPLMTSCSTAPPAAAVKAESAGNVAVITAMTAWGAYVAAYHPGVGPETQVKTFFLATRSAELALVDATSSWVLSQTNSVNGTNMPPNVIAAQAALVSASADLVNVVSILSVKPTPK